MILKYKRYIPILIFLLVLTLIVFATIYYSPSWGLMDDAQNLERASRVWNSNNFLKSLWSILEGDLFGWGMFRPVYYSWAVFTYHLFKNSPLLIYIIIAIFNMAVILLWGSVLHRIYKPRKENVFLEVFLFPLSFFIFLPFWNVFMYISSQQKFILFFSALALYFFERAYSKNKSAFLFISTFFVLLSVLSHPEGIYLTIVFIVFSLLDILFFHYKKGISFISLLINTLLCLLYFVFSLKIQMKGEYTSRYASNLNLAGIINNFLGASIVIKVLVVFAVLMSIFSFVRITGRKNSFSPLFSTIPLGLLSYFAVLSPWGYPNYHLSVAAPYALGMGFPLYFWINKKSKINSFISNIFLILLVFISFFFIIIPRISKMAGIKKTEEFIMSFNLNNYGNKYFLPFSCMEATDALKYFTKANITYLADGILSDKILKDVPQNYLICRDECWRVSLIGVVVDKEIYQNKTWKIFHILKRQGNLKEFKANFSENFIGKVKTYLRNSR